jgi:hypothetical protein
VSSREGPVQHRTETGESASTPSQAVKKAMTLVDSMPDVVADLEAHSATSSGRPRALSVRTYLILRFALTLANKPAHQSAMMELARGLGTGQLRAIGARRPNANVVTHRQCQHMTICLSRYVAAAADMDLGFELAAGAVL